MIERAAGQADRARVSLTRGIGLLDAIREQIDSSDTNRRITIARARRAPVRELSQLLTVRGFPAEAERLERSWLVE